MKKLIFPALAASLFASVAMADPMATITARQEWYKSLGAVMKPMSELAKAYDAEAVKAEAAKLEAALAVDTSGFYPEGTSATEFPGKTRAKPEIWANMDDVAAKGKAMGEAAAELIAVAIAGDEAAFGPAFGKLGGTCKACHDSYRIPEE